MLERGFIQVYTGEGKGKTTAAVGLAIRALGAGLRVAFLQFFKPETSSEVKVLKGFAPQLFYASFHHGGFVGQRKDLPENLKEEILKGYQLFQDLLASARYDLLVLDEVTYALTWGIISLKDFLETLKNKPKEVEVVITGRGAPQELLEVAHLVTEMRPLKHYYAKGVRARWGIEK